MSEPSAGTLAIAGREPVRVLHPRSLAELREVVRERDGTTLVPVGSGLHQGLGAAPRGPWTAVFLREALAGALSHQEDDLTLVAPAGLTLGEVNDVLAARGQRLPLDPPLAGGATLGGVLAAQAAGPLRSRFGLPRDLVLGMTVLRADGELVRAGGRVVKNVTGYDLMRLWCGSLGTLGIITEVALRVYPFAPTVALAAPSPTPGEAIATVEALYRADLRPEIADVAVAGGEVNLFVCLPEPAAAAARRIMGRAALLDPTERDVRYAAIRDAGYLQQGGLLIQVSAPPSRLADAALELAALLPGLTVIRPIASVVRAAWEPPGVPPIEAVAALVGRLRSRLAGGGGAVTLEVAPPGWADSIDPWGVPAGGAEIMRRLKAAYDPDGRLNLGRFALGI